MNRALQVYYRAIFGMCGGLIAWLVIGQLPTWHWPLWPAVAFIGAGSGLFIGGAVGAVHGAVVKGSLTQTLLGFSWGAASGIASGLLGLMIGQAVFLLTGGGLVGRALGWTFFGMFLGASQIRLNVGWRRIGYGAVGGSIAGLIGGLVYEGATQLFLARSGSAQMVLSALGLGLIGASLGGITAFSVELLEKMVGRGLVVVKSGARSGMEIPVIDLVSLGRNDACDVYLPGDDQIAEIHARIGKQQDGYFLQNMALSNPITMDGKPISTVPVQLRDGTIVQLGKTLIEFHEQHESGAQA